MALAKKTAYDLIVFDEHFGIDAVSGEEFLKGTDATRILRKAGCPALIIGLTGDEGPEHNKKAEKAGQDHVLGKPFFSAKDFSRLVGRLLSHRSAVALEAPAAETGSS